MTISIDVLFNDLLLDLGLTYDEDLTIFPWDTSSVAAKKALAKSFTKKYRDKTSADADRVALETFLASNEKCGKWQLKCESLLDEMLLGQFKYWTWKFFKGNAVDVLGDSLDEIFSSGRNGPGASLGLRVPTFYTKLFASPMTCTSTGLHGAYANYVKRFPYWSDAEETRRSLYGTNRVVAGNRMSFVPKNVTTSRSICTEPTLNMFCQLGLGEIIEARLREVFSLDVSTQPEYNRALARNASETGDLSTIDLSSASDSMSLEMLRWCLPGPFFGMLEILRSPQSHIVGYGDVKLNMVSTMGNGFTFPLMTSLLSCVVAACFDVANIQRINNPRNKNLFEARVANWGVFGDDIIVPTGVTQMVFRLLDLLGFEPNRDKSFSEGHFRESCGVDSFKGVDIRGVYVKTLREPQDRYTVINQLLAWSDKHGIYLLNTIKRLMQSVRPIAVPAWEAEDCGVRVPYAFLIRKGLVRRNRYGTFAYKRFVPRSRTIRFFEDYECVPTTKDMGPIGYNPSGLLLSFIAGHLEGASDHEFRKERVTGQIRVKPNLVRFSLKTGVAPAWDYHPTVRSPYGCSVGGGDPKGSPLLITLMSSWV